MSTRYVWAINEIGINKGKTYTDDEVLARDEFCVTANYSTEIKANGAEIELAGSIQTDTFYYYESGLVLSLSQPGYAVLETDAGARWPNRGVYYISPSLYLTENYETDCAIVCNEDFEGVNTAVVYISYQRGALVGLVSNSASGAYPARITPRLRRSGGAESARLMRPQYPQKYPLMSNLR